MTGILAQSQRVEKALDTFPHSNLPISMHFMFVLQ